MYTCAAVPAPIWTGRDITCINYDLLVAQALLLVHIRSLHPLKSGIHGYKERRTAI